MALASVVILGGCKVEAEGHPMPLSFLVHLKLGSVAEPGSLDFEINRRLRWNEKL